MINGVVGACVRVHMVSTLLPIAYRHLILGYETSCGM